VIKTLIGTALAAALVLMPTISQADDNQVAGGAGTATRATNESSTFTLVAIGVGGLAIIGAVVAGSTNNGTTSTTGTAKH
jgi:hypothetical protein